MDENKLDFSGVDDINNLPDDQLNFEGLQEEKPSYLSKAANNLVGMGANASGIGLEGAQNVAQTAVDLGAGIAQGATLGGADEAAGAINATVEPLTDKFYAALQRLKGEPSPEELAMKSLSPELQQKFQPAQEIPEDWAQRYRGYQQEAQKMFQESAERSPIAYGAGELAGGIATGGAVAGTGKKVAQQSLKEILKSEGGKKAATELLKRIGKEGIKQAPAGAAFGALGSEEGALIGATPEQKEQLLNDTLGGATMGIALGGGAGAISETAPLAAQKVKDTAQELFEKNKPGSPLLRQIEGAYDYGKQLINPISEIEKLGKPGAKSTVPLVRKDELATRKLMDEIQQADEVLGKEVGATLDNAITNGVQFEVGGDLKKNIDLFKSLGDQFPPILERAKTRKLYQKMFNEPQAKYTVDEMLNLRDDMSDLLDSLKGDTATAANETRKVVYQIRDNVVNELKTNVPGYRQAAERFSNFRKMVPETIMAGKTPEDIADISYGSLKRKDEKLYGSINDIVKGSAKEGYGSTNQKLALLNTKEGLKNFEQTEAAKLAQGKIKSPALKRQSSEILGDLERAADDSALRQDMDVLNPQTGAPRTLLRAVLGSADSGRSITLRGANVAGMAAKKSQDIGKRLYQASDDKLNNIAQQFKQIPGLTKYGEALERGIQNKSQAAKNAAIFTILQNPDARLRVPDSIDVGEEQ